MSYNYRYRLNPSDDIRERLAWTVDTCRQVYNHFLHRLSRHDDTSAYSEQKRLPDLKDWWNDLQDVHSKVLQKVVQRLYDNLSTLQARKRCYAMKTREVLAQAVIPAAGEGARLSPRRTRSPSRLSRCPNRVLCPSAGDLPSV